MKINKSIFISLFASVLLLSQVGCGDSTDNLDFVENQFPDHRALRYLCEKPRSGTDLNGNAFFDNQGTRLHELQWLRAWSNDTYLWYDEIPDQNPITFNSPQSYFDVLRTEQLTASGNPKDNFHFLLPTDEWQQRSQAGVSVGYGVRFSLEQTSPPRSLFIKFVEPNTPAAQVIARGAEVLEIDGVDVINAADQTSVDTLNAGLSPSSAGESHSFTIRDVGATETRTITLTASVIAADPVPFVDTIATDNGNVGYVFFNNHNAVSEQRLFEAFTELAEQNVDDLVLDLRYNGGGFLAIASQLAYMIAGETATTDKTFETLSFNDKYPDIDPVTGRDIFPTPFYDITLGFSDLDVGLDLPTLDLSRVFILATDDTCSASESVINSLEGIDIEVILIGSTTCGKPFGFYPTDNCGTTYFTIQFQGENDKGFGEYADGFSPANTAGTIGTLVPGCSVADDLSHQLGDTEEALLETALSFRDTGSCPIPTGLAIKQKVQTDSLEFENSDKKLDIRLPKQFNEKVNNLPSSRDLPPFSS